MEGGDKKEMARKMAAQRAKPGRKPLGGAAPSAGQRANSLSFFSEDADGWTMSPKTILLFSVAYMGFVILLHIFGKVTSIKKDPSSMDMDPGAEGANNGTAGDL